MAGVTRSTTPRTALRVLGTLASGFGGLLALMPAGWAEQPHDWELGMQAPATPVDQHLQAFHDELLVIIFLITIFVMGLLLYVIVRFHHSRNPVPTKTSHNAVVEILWTVIPVLILVAIAIPSFKLMYYMDRVPPDSMTINVTGHQWYWSYNYPKEKISFDSNSVPDKDLKPGQPRLLTVDNPLVVPAGTNVRVLVTSTDVIHSWYVPSFGVQEYAIIGRENHAWFNVLHPGTFYGECNQICGINHSHMTIEVVALSKPDFAKWLQLAKKQYAADAPASDSPQPGAMLIAAARRRTAAPTGLALAGN
ncbi:MAG TPA: cytochrome c oxidase subunit II [Stellaceae bacterium]|nr:cytochrome c oxidase subunit II [Stellaceae bacterium]